MDIRQFVKRKALLITEV